MSGGVDSAVAALLLTQQGHSVTAVFMQNWEQEQDDPYCTISQDLHDAKQVCAKLDIPLTTVNFSKEYWQLVFTKMLDQYAQGYTPNPDILCNKEIKFKAFLQYALAQGADYIATGHYARILHQDNCYKLLQGTDRHKDQSYFLYTLSQAQLARAIFPLGELQKPTVRNIAAQAKLANHAKKDSTGICFIGERNFKNFLSEFLLAQPGDIVTPDNKVIGRHSGLMFYTLGQRKGLGIGGQKHSQEAPWYVVAKDTKTNHLIVAQQHDHPYLLRAILNFHNAHWISGVEPKFPCHCQAKIRYQHEQQDCVVNHTEVTFNCPQWAITPGQAIVFYQDAECLGGGFVSSLA